ncbi:MAG: type III pantothenate kinase [Synechococcus sp.]
MRASEGVGRWLLIGNSRWHWALRDEAPGAAPRFLHTSPGEVPAGGPLWGWAAVGPLPQGREPWLRGVPPLRLEQVPLKGLPPWLGIDRALAGWAAWCRQPGSVLVADAGTALSLTLVDGAGRFRGGRLQPGVALQLRALAAGTAALPSLPPLAAADEASGNPWPQATAAAMAEGVIGGLTAALAAAALEARQLLPGCGLWLTGGDGERLGRRLAESGTGRDQNWRLAPDLVLEALVALAPVQSSPRSSRI